MDHSIPDKQNGFEAITKLRQMGFDELICLHSTDTNTFTSAQKERFYTEHKKNQMIHKGAPSLPKDIRRELEGFLKQSEPSITVKEKAKAPKTAPIAKDAKPKEKQKISMQSAPNLAHLSLTDIGSTSPSPTTTPSPLRLRNLFSPTTLASIPEYSVSKSTSKFNQ